MKNLRRLLAVVVVVAVMATFCVPAFAAAIPADAQICADLGILKGTGDGVTPDYLRTTPLRYQAAIMLLRLQGREADALGYLGIGTFTDANDLIWVQGRAMLSYLKANPSLGFGGYPDGTFKPNAPITAKEYYKVLLMTLGYKYGPDFNWANVLSFAATKGLYKAFEANPFTVYDFAVATVEALKAQMADGSGTLIANLVKTGVVDEAAAIASNLYVKPVITEVAAIDDIAIIAGQALNLPASVLATYTDGSKKTVAITWPEVDNTVPMAKTEVLGTIEGTTVKAKVNVTIAAVQLAVTGATGTNIKEIVVTFNKELNASTVVGANFKVGGTATAVALGADKKSVTVTVPTLDTVPPADYALAVSGVKDTDGVTVTAYSATVRIIDTQVPSVLGAQLIAPAQFELVFSEPIVGAGSVLINNGVYGCMPVAPTGTNKVVVNLGGALPEGNYTVSVAGYTDTSGLPMDAASVNLLYAKVTTPVTVSLVSASQTQVVVKFSAPILQALDVNYFYHTFSTWKPDAVTSSGNQTYTLTFTSFPIPEGTYYLTVLNNGSAGKISDAWGNQMAASAVLEMGISADKTAPTVVVKGQAETYVEVEFADPSGLVGIGTTGNYAVKNAAGGAVTITGLVQTGNKVKLQFAAQAGGAYTVTISNITDNSLAKNAMPATTLSFTITDTTAPTVTGATYVQTPTPIIYVTFSEPMATEGVGSVLDKNNYRVNGAALAANATVATFGSASKVKITLPGVTLPGAGQLTFGQLADASGNKIAALATTIGMTAEGKPAISSVTTVDAQTIKIVINKVITSISANSFYIDASVHGNVYHPAMISYSNNGSVTTVIATLRAENQLAGPASGPADVTVVASSILSDTGLWMDAGAYTSFTDGIAPSKASITGGTGLINVVFNEGITGTYAHMFINDLVVTQGSTVLVPGVGYTTSLSGGNTIVIKGYGGANLAAGSYKVRSQASFTYIQDLAGNKPNAFTADTAVTVN